MDDIIKIENIRLNVRADNWQEAIEKAGELLLNSGCITEEYIESMINSINDLGPYIVIAPHIAIAHARPSKNVLKSDISLVTLKDPVNFGHQQNDPVNLLFAFSAFENTGHLKQLSRIAELIEDEERLESILKSDEVEAAYKIINYK